MRIVQTLLALFFSVLTLAAQAPDKNDPLFQSKGDQKRTYKFPETGESISYRTYVPSFLYQPLDGGPDLPCHLQSDNGTRPYQTPEKPDRWSVYVGTIFLKKTGKV